MNTHYISSALQNTQNSSGVKETISTQTEAWRKVFEQEQAAILSQAKSVKLDTGSTALSQQQSTTNENSSDLVQTKNEDMPRLTPSTAEAVDATKSTPSQSANTAEWRSFRSLQINTDLHNNLISTQNTLVVQKFSAATEMLPAVISLFESHYKQKWPLRNVHLIQTEEGVVIWIRDAALHAAPKHEIEALAEKINQSLIQDGQKLVGLSINGKTVLGNI